MALLVDAEKSCFFGLGVFLVLGVFFVSLHFEDMFMLSLFGLAFKFFNKLTVLLHKIYKTNIQVRLH